MCFLCWYQRFSNGGDLLDSKSLNLTNFMPSAEGFHEDFLLLRVENPLKQCLNHRTVKLSSAHLDNDNDNESF